MSENSWTSARGIPAVELGSIITFATRRACGSCGAESDLVVLAFSD